MYPAKTGEYPRDIPQFSKLRVFEKYLMDNKHKTFHLAQNYDQIVVRGHYLFQKANNLLS